MESVVTTRLTTLGHPQRLAVFRLLMRRYPDRVPASEIAAALGLKANTLSTYVNALMQAGLVTQERVGTSRLYAVDMAATRDTFDYLLTDCCRGRPEVCELTQITTPAPPEAFNVLFICSGNAARSIMAEALLRDLGGGRFTVQSAGTQPRAAVNPRALQVLSQNGHETAVLRPKDIAAYQEGAGPVFDFVITVCDQAANKDCPAWPDQPISAHWGMPAPGHLSGGSEADKHRAFEQTYAALRARITAFCALPFPSLDRISLQRAIDQIGQTQEETHL